MGKKSLTSSVRFRYFKQVALRYYSQYRGYFSDHPIHPLSKAEPFKHWLAKVGYERTQEIEDPELAAKRGRAIFKKIITV